MNGETMVKATNFQRENLQRQIEAMMAEEPTQDNGKEFWAGFIGGVFLTSMIVFSYWLFRFLAH
jgi:hypothetical protein